MAQKRGTKSKLLLISSSNEKLTSNSSKGNLYMSRRQPRDQPKKASRQEPAKTPTTLQPPQQVRQFPTNQGSRNLYAVPVSRQAKTNNSDKIRTVPTSLNQRLTDTKKIQTAKRRPSLLKFLSARSTTPRKKPLDLNPRPKATNHQRQPKGKLGRSQPRPLSPLMYLTRLLIVGVGIGAIVGTFLSIWDSSSRHSVEAAANTNSTVEATPAEKKNTITVAMGQEIVAIKPQLEALATANPKLQAGVFVLDLDTGAYLDYNSSSTFSAASTIKVPVLVAFFQDVDAGKVSLDEMLTMEPEMIAKGSGDMQYQKAGKQFTALETATKMIAISDNTATNMLITRLGGAEALNQRFRSWGLVATTINKPLPDLEGNNSTSPQELANVMVMVNEGRLVSVRSRDRILDIMRQTVTKTLLPPGLGKGATIAHKTGDIGSILADVGLIDMPIGKRYVASVMVQRPHNDVAARKLIQQISRLTYQYFDKSAVSPITPAIPESTPNSMTRAFTGENPAPSN
ncbi:penicillin-binding protein transpeptidase [Crinalium epipsammum PCC 9333]|uniref:Penicillin-binding protein transpeptidase n=2 Tax=Crinalium TaxID=241421 RepID=K9VW32_9CYAN|nr:penicillin-binding protein transpeptidase [Crinalium epipsammum PCC 9333]